MKDGEEQPAREPIRPAGEEPQSPSATIPKQEAQDEAPPMPPTESLSAQGEAEEEDTASEQVYLPEGGAAAEEADTVKHETSQLWRQYPHC